jgi:hypothetical protein
MKTNKILQTKKALLSALEASLGVVTIACRNVGVSRVTFYEYLKEDPEFAEAVREMDDVVLDFAESQLHKQIKDNNTAATIFYLKTKGKRRGYVESQHHDHTTDGKPIQLPVISFEWPEDNE